MRTWRKRIGNLTPPRSPSGPWGCAQSGMHAWNEDAEPSRTQRGSSCVSCAVPWVLRASEAASCCHAHGPVLGPAAAHGGSGAQRCCGERSVALGCSLDTQAEPRGLSGSKGGFLSSLVTVLCITLCWLDFLHLHEITANLGFSMKSFPLPAGPAQGGCLPIPHTAPPATVCGSHWSVSVGSECNTHKSFAANSAVSAAHENLGPLTVVPPCRWATS